MLYLLYILSLLIGGSLIGVNRRKNLSIDIIGRLLFSYGFYNIFIMTNVLPLIE